MLSRLETMVLSGAVLPVEVIRKQIASAIDIMVHLSRLRDRSRRILEISEMAGMKNGEIILNPLYTFQEQEGGNSFHVNGCLARTGNSLVNEFKLKMAGMPT